LGPLQSSQVGPAAIGGTRPDERVYGRAAKGRYPGAGLGTQACLERPQLGESLSCRSGVIPALVRCDLRAARATASLL